MLIHKETRTEIVQLFIEYYDAGHIVGINAEVLGNKFADRLEFTYPTLSKRPAHVVDAVAKMIATGPETIAERDSLKKQLTHQNDEYRIALKAFLDRQRELEAERDTLRAEVERLTGVVADARIAVNKAAGDSAAFRRATVECEGYIEENARLREALQAAVVAALAKAQS